MKKKEKIKVYGERNTNTNYLSKLIKLNLEIVELPGIVPTYLSWIQKVLPGTEWLRDLNYGLRQNKYVWKHTCIEGLIDIVKNMREPKNIHYIALTKNPYSWLLSLYKKPYHIRKGINLISFEEFLETPIKTTKRDRCPRMLKNPIELWNIKNSSYMKISEIDGLNITTESLLLNPEFIIKRISNHFNIRRISKSFINYEHSTKNEDKNYDYYKNYYCNELWKNEISKKSIKIINNYIDMNVMKHFGYQKIN